MEKFLQFLDTDNNHYCIPVEDVIRIKPVFYSSEFGPGAGAIVVYYAGDKSGNIIRRTAADYGLYITERKDVIEDLRCYYNS